MTGTSHRSTALALTALAVTTAACASMPPECLTPRAAPAIRWTRVAPAPCFGESSREPLTPIDLDVMTASELAEASARPGGLLLRTDASDLAELDVDPLIAFGQGALTKRAIDALAGVRASGDSRKRPRASDATELTTELLESPFAVSAERTARARAELLIENGELEEAFGALADLSALERGRGATATWATSMMKTLASTLEETLATSGTPRGTELIHVEQIENFIGVQSGLLIAAAPSAYPPSVVALDARGDERWCVTLPAPGLAYVVGLGRVFVVGSDGVMAIDARTGRTRWVAVHALWPRASVMRVALRVSPRSLEVLGDGFITLRFDPFSGRLLPR